MLYLETGKDSVFIVFKKNVMCACSVCVYVYLCILYCIKVMPICKEHVTLCVDVIL